MTAITEITIEQLHQELQLEGELSESLIVNILSRLKEDTKRYLKNPILLNEKPVVCVKCGSSLTTEDICMSCANKKTQRGYFSGRGVFG